MYNHLFSEITIKGLTLKNRLTMAPLYLGYAGEGGTVSDMLLEHYRLMAGSGVAMVVVENATVDHPCGSGSNRTLRADTDDNLDGLKRLSAVIKQEGALACLQINHAGRFAHATQEPVAPSAVKTFGGMPRALQIPFNPGPASSAATGIFRPALAVATAAVVMAMVVTPPMSIPLPTTTVMGSLTEIPLTPVASR